MLCGVAGSLLKRVIRLLGVRPCVPVVVVLVRAAVGRFGLGGQQTTQSDAPHATHNMNFERSEGSAAGSSRMGGVSRALASVLQELAPKTENRRRGAGAVASWTVGIANSSIRPVSAADRECDERTGAGGVQ